MSELWTPDFADRYEAQEGYMRYAAGVAIAHSPDYVERLHGLTVETDDQREQLLLHAQTLIWTGLHTVIKYSNPPSIRGVHQEVRRRHDEALPFMVALVDDLAAQKAEELEALNRYLPVMKPLPLVHEPVYKAIAHADKKRVSLDQTMDSFTVHTSFGNDAGQRNFGKVRQRKAPAGGQISRDEQLLSSLYRLRDGVSGGLLPDDK